MSQAARGTEEMVSDRADVPSPGGQGHGTVTGQMSPPQGDVWDF